MNYLSAALAYMSRHGKKHMTIKRVTNKYTLIDTGECRTRMGGGGVVVVVTSTVGRDDNTAPPHTGTAFDTRARTRRVVGYHAHPLQHLDIQHRRPYQILLTVVFGGARARRASSRCLNRQRPACLRLSRRIISRTIHSPARTRPVRWQRHARATACSLYGACWHLQTYRDIHFDICQRI